LISLIKRHLEATVVVAELWIVISYDWLTRAKTTRKNRILFFRS
jgi:hypothetical protein